MYYDVYIITCVISRQVSGPWGQEKWGALLEVRLLGNHSLVWLAKAPRCPCTDALGGNKCRRVATPSRSTSPFPEGLDYSAGGRGLPRVSPRLPHPAPGASHRRSGKGSQLPVCLQRAGETGEAEAPHAGLRCLACRGGGRRERMLAFQRHTCPPCFRMLIRRCISAHTQGCLKPSRLGAANARRALPCSFPLCQKPS